MRDWGRPVPTLGYPSKTAAMVALHRRGLSYSEVGRRIGVSPATVSNRLRAIGEVKAAARTYVYVPLWLVEQLKPLAEARGFSPNALAAEIVETVVREGLVEAVLDDEGPGRLAAE